MTAPSAKKETLYLRRGKKRLALPGVLRAPMPKTVEPMLATLVDEPFSDPDWLFENKWDGVRALCYINDGEMRLVSRNEKELGFRYPELADIAKSIDVKQAVLDGELVTLNDKGQPSFQLLQHRIGLTEKEEIERLAKETPAVYYVFDLLYYNGYNLMPAPLMQRKTLLKALMRPSRVLKFSTHTLQHGEKLFVKAQKANLEGIIAKRRESAYVQKRSSQWLKIKTQLRQEVVIAGYTEPRGSREHFGALVVGLYRDAELHYVGHVGGGFNRQSLEQVYQAMQPLKTERSPFVEKPHTNEPVQWLKPQRVGEVKFAEWTSDGRMRQPIFLGLRDDKDPHDAKFETKHEVKQEMEKAEQQTAEKNKRAGEAMSLTQMLKTKELSGNAQLKVGPHVVPLTHLDKLYWPDEGYTKGDLLKYYAQVGKYIVPHLRDRPLILMRFPNGIKQDFFYQHEVKDAPDFVRTEALKAEEGRVIDYAVGDNLATLLYLANLGTIAQNPWHSRVSNIDHPDWIVFDLDPEKADFEVVCEVALALKDVLQRLGLKGYAKTSGASGMHVYVPIKAIYSYEQVADFAQRVAALVTRENEDCATLERSLKKRKAGRVYVDHLQNAKGKTAASVYSVRARAGATVSTPLDWDEVAAKPSPSDFTLENMPRRLAQKGDLFKAVLSKKQALGNALKKLEHYTDATDDTDKKN